MVRYRQVLPLFGTVVEMGRVTRCLIEIFIYTCIMQSLFHGTRLCVGGSEIITTREKLW
jgi:hypothetical protein